MKGESKLPSIYNDFTSFFPHRSLILLFFTLTDPKLYFGGWTGIDSTLSPISDRRSEEIQSENNWNISSISKTTTSSPTESHYSTEISSTISEYVNPIYTKSQYSKVLPYEFSPQKTFEIVPKDSLKIFPKIFSQIFPKEFLRNFRRELFQIIPEEYFQIIPNDFFQIDTENLLRNFRSELSEIIPEEFILSEFQYFLLILGAFIAMILSKTTGGLDLVLTIFLFFVERVLGIDTDIFTAGIYGVATNF